MSVSTSELELFLQKMRTDFQFKWFIFLFIYKHVNKIDQMQDLLYRDTLFFIKYPHSVSFKVSSVSISNASCEFSRCGMLGNIPGSSM